MSLGPYEISIALPPVGVGYFSFPFSVNEEACDGSPALLLGWELGSVPEAVTEPAAPNALLSLSQQHGGLSCLQAELLGVLLPIRGNTERVLGGVAMAGALDLLAEGNPSRATRKKLRAIGAVLDGSWLTMGWDFEQQALEAWSELLSTWLPGLPPIEWGREALLKFEGTDLGVFAGWRAIVVRSDRAQIQVIKTAVVTGQHLQQLHLIGKQLQLGEPRLWLLWENSD